jgi:hypothetical protein
VKLTAVGATALELGSTTTGSVSNNVIECTDSLFCSGMYFSAFKSNIVVAGNVVRALATSSACVRDEVAAFRMYARYSVSNVSVTDNRFEAFASGSCSAAACTFEQYHDDPIQNVTFQSNYCFARWSDGSGANMKSDAAVAANVLASNLTLVNNTFATSQVHIQTDQELVDTDSSFRVVGDVLSIVPVRIAVGCPALTVRHIDAHFENATERNLLEVLPWSGNGCGSQSNFTNSAGATVYSSTLLLAAPPLAGALVAPNVTVLVRNATGVVVATVPAPSGSTVARLVVDVVVTRGLASRRGSPFTVLASDPSIKSFDQWTGESVRLCIDRERIDLCSAFTTLLSTATMTALMPAKTASPTTALSTTSAATTLLLSAPVSTARPKGDGSVDVSGDSSTALIGAVVGAIIGCACLVLAIGSVCWCATKRNRPDNIRPVEIVELQSARGIWPRSEGVNSTLTMPATTLQSPTPNKSDLSQCAQSGAVASVYTNIPELLHDDYGVGDLHR